MWSPGVQLWNPEFHRVDTDLLKQVQRKATKMIKRMDDLSCKERLRKLGLFRLEQRSLWGHLIAPFQHL